MMKSKTLGSIDYEGEYNILSKEDKIILETVDENGNIILNFIDDEE